MAVLTESFEASYFRDLIPQKPMARRLVVRRGIPVNGVFATPRRGSATGIMGGSPGPLRRLIDHRIQRGFWLSLNQSEGIVLYFERGARPADVQRRAA